MYNNIHSVNFKDLNIKDLYLSNNKILIVKKNNTDFYLKIFLKQNSNVLIAFSNGARDPKKRTSPFFSRSSWQNEIKSHCIFIDDPTLHNTNLRVGWGVGTKSHYFLSTISEIIKRITHLLKIDDENTFYFGSSAGGYMSLLLATMHKNSSSIVNNPQFDVKEERSIPFVKRKYPDMSKEEIIENYSIRFSFYKLLKTENYFPNIKYILNRYSEVDIDRQYTPFIDFLDKNKSFSEKVDIIQYHAVGGHGAMYKKEKTIELLNGIISAKVGSDSFENTQNLNPISNKFNINNKQSETILSNPFRGDLKIPLEYFLPGYHAEVKYIFGLEIGLLKIKLRSKYFSKSGLGSLRYEISKNSELIASEDMAKWSKENDICLFNLKKGDEISIKVIALKKRTNTSWSEASTLSILEYKEIPTRSSVNKNITYTSPVMLSDSKE